MSDGTQEWIVYGLLANNADSHDLRFIEVTTTPQTTCSAHPEYETCAAFPKDTWCQLYPNSRTEIAPVAALMGRDSGAHFPNAAEQAG